MVKVSLVKRKGCPSVIYDDFWNTPFFKTSLSVTNLCILNWMI